MVNKIFNKNKQYILGLMVHIIKDTILKDKNKDSVYINILLLLGMLDSGKIINKMG